MTFELVVVFIRLDGKCECIAPVTALLKYLGELPNRDRFRETRRRTPGACQRLDMLLIVPRDDDHREILAACFHYLEQSKSMRPVLEIDYGSVQIAASPADNLERVTGVVCQMANATSCDERICDNILQRRIARQQNYNWRLHKPSFGRSIS